MKHIVIVSLILVPLLVARPVAAKTIDEQCKEEIGISDFTGRNAAFESVYDNCIRGKESQERELELRSRAKLHRANRQERLSERARNLTERRRLQVDRLSSGQTRTRGTFYDDLPKDTSASKLRELRTKRRGDVRALEGETLEEVPSEQDIATTEAIAKCEHLRVSMRNLCVRKELLKKRQIRYYRYRE